jgi:hypothetical protein
MTSPRRFERRHEPLAPRRHFALRLVRSAAWGFAFIAVSLFIGMTGYRVFEHMPWLDAFLNASMLLSGMGPLASPQTDAGKLFAGLYALYSGFAVLIGAAIIFAPVIHRALHRFHLEESDKDQ